MLVDVRNVSKRREKIVWESVYNLDVRGIIKKGICSNVNENR